MILCAEVAGYELVLAKTPNNQWSVSLRGTGRFLTPLHQIHESLDDAKRHACQWAAQEAGIPVSTDLLERIRWKECRGY
jgi:hypothetical protein